MGKEPDLLPVLGRSSNADVLPVLGRPSLDWPVHDFRPAGTAIHGKPLHLTGTFGGNTQKSHVPYVGQTTLPMFDNSLGPTFKLPELRALAQSPETASVFSGSGLDWGRADPPPHSTDSSNVGGQSRERDQVRPVTLPGSWLANQRHWLGDNGPSQLDTDDNGSSSKFDSTKCLTHFRYQAHLFDPPVTSIKMPEVDNGCFRGTATLKPVGHDSVYEHGLRMVHWGNSLGMERSQHVYYGQCSLQAWGDSLPMFGGR